MAYGIFDSDGNHLVTYDYGDCKTVAENMVRGLGYGYYSRELTSEEYWERMREIFVIGKYKNNKRGER